ncbi:hypothetical protein ACI2KL_09120, partial [Pseudomonas yamanorum]
LTVQISTKLNRSHLMHGNPVLSGRAIENIENSMLDELVVTNTIPLSAAAQACSRIRQLDIAPVVAEAVRRISNEESISAMFR